MPAMTLPDGTTTELPDGEPIGSVLPREAIAARVDGQLVDLAFVPSAAGPVTPVLSSEPDGLHVLRHSAAHVMAQAVCDLFPGARYAIGPAIEDGFYYDFELPEPATEADLDRIEKRMRHIAKQNQAFVREELSRDEALARFADQPFKIEIIQKVSAAGDEVAEEDAAEVGTAETVSVYRNDGWGDLCLGPHVPSTSKLGAFKLTSIAGAYWRGDSSGPMLTRIYGTAWPTRQELEEYLHRLAEAEKRDHRKLGQDLDLFSFPEEIGSGLAVFHPRGGLMRKLMEDYSRRRHEEAGYDFVQTPHITKSGLFETSGHLDWFAEGMFPPMELDGGTQYYLKPMNCPFHILIYKNRMRSYRDLPMRLFEFGTVYRYEPSGVVHGLTRVRGMTQDDAHIFCTKEMMPGELHSLLTFVLDLLREYGLDDFYLELSTRPEGKAVGSVEEWDEATEILRQAAAKMNLDLVMDEGGGAFYGPKISVQARDAIGRTWQMSTIQLDFQLPQLFDLHYVGDDNERHRPTMIHRALFGTVERFFAILVEHYAGAFPLWLAPEQVRIAPVADRHIPAAMELATRLREAGLRPEVDESAEKVGKKVRNAQIMKVPYVLVVGDNEAESGVLNVRHRSGVETPDVPVQTFIDALVAEAETRSLEPAFAAEEAASDE